MQLGAVGSRAKPFKDTLGSCSFDYHNDAEDKDILVAVPAL